MEGIKAFITHLYRSFDFLVLSRRREENKKAVPVKECIISKLALAFLVAGGFLGAEAATYASTNCASSGIALMDQVTAVGTTANPVLGCNASGNGQSAVSVSGTDDQGAGEGASVYGFDSLAGTWTSAFELSSTATGNGITGLGFRALTPSTGTVAIPKRLDGAVVLSNNSTVAASAPTANAITNDVTYNRAGASPATGGLLGVGVPGSERQATYVAVGNVTGTSTDAVNGSQLFDTTTAGSRIGITLNSIVNSGTGVKYFHSNSTSADLSAIGSGSVAVGPLAVSSGATSIAVGNNASAAAADSSALGANSSATGIRSISVGNTLAAGAGSIAIGSRGSANSSFKPTASGSDAIAIGASNTQAFGLRAVSIGRDSWANGDNSTAVGYNSEALGLNAAAFGTSALAHSDNSLALGPGTIVTAVKGIAVGNGANVSTANSIALGSGASTAAASVTTGATINGKVYTYAGGAPIGVLSLGTTGSERQITNVAAGQVNGTSTDAVNGSQLFATNTAVNGVGTTLNNIVSGSGIKYFHANSTLADSTATGIDSVAIGPQSVSGAAQSLAAGAGASANATGSVALGNLSSVQVLGGVALGQGSISDRAIAPSAGLIPVGIGAIRYDTSDATLLGAVSLGKSGQYRQLTNVADGTSSQDAVTLRQLTGAIGSISTTGTMYFHANVTNAQDSLSLGQESIAVGPATVVNGDKGIGIGNQATVGQAATGGIAVGRNSQVLLVSGIAIGSQAEARGEQSLALGAGAVASQATSIALGSSSVTTTGAQSGYTAYGLSAPQTSVGELGIGTALGDRKITGVAGGSALNDAVNVAQLTSVGDRVTQNTLSITNLGGRVTTIEGNINNITNGGGVKYFHANSTQPDSVASGADSLAIGGNANASGGRAVASGNGAQASGVGAVAMGNGARASADGSVSVGQGASDNGRGAENYAGKYSSASNTSVGTVSVGNAATGQTRTISNVADGRLETDAVNVRQLDGAVAVSKQYTDDSLKTVNTNLGNVTGAITAVDNRVTQVESNVTKVQNGIDGMFQVNNTSAGAKPSATGNNAVAGGAGSVASGNNSAAVGTNAKASGANSVAVGNGASATGSNSTALGANSMADRNNSVSVGTKGNERQITNVAAATQGTDAVNFDQLNKSVSNITNNVNAYTDQRYSELKRDLKKQDDTLSAGIAGAMAMASLPQPYSPGASMMSIGAANYRGQSAVSFGVSTISKNGHWVGKLQAITSTQGDAGMGVGVGYQW
ncbi:YadA family autotransporter adhesin [Pseudomonas simiae]|uniref:YadA family autotransporter adhesin n=1 Tax=Pseudomonas simiae TaxID=321846 RepID=UPI001586278A|nr:YadA-like family protein [Pseudomonas simiae]